MTTGSNAQVDEQQKGNKLTIDMLLLYEKL